MNLRFFTLLFQLACFVKCKRTLLELNSWELYPCSEREKKLCRPLFTSSIKREITHFRVVVVQWRQRNVQKSVLHVQSCCFAHSTHCFFDVLVAILVLRRLINNHSSSPNGALGQSSSLQRRRRRQPGRQERNRFITQNNNFARASRFFVHFFTVLARLRRENV